MKDTQTSNTINDFFLEYISFFDIQAGFVRTEISYYWFNM